MMMEGAQTKPSRMFFREAADKRRRLSFVSLATLALAPLLASCGNLPVSQTSNSEMTLKVADAALTSGAPELALHIAETKLQ
jgi:hypothetical protein